MTADDNNGDQRLAGDDELPAGKRRSGSMDTTDVKDFGAEPQMSSARFCSR